MAKTKGKKATKLLKRRETAPAEKPVSLRPLKFEEAVKGLMRVKKGLATTRKSDS